LRIVAIPSPGRKSERFAGSGTRSRVRLMAQARDGSSTSLHLRAPAPPQRGGDFNDVMVEVRQDCSDNDLGALLLDRRRRGLLGLDLR
jgi:hypothetical protein